MLAPALTHGGWTRHLWFHRWACLPGVDGRASGVLRLWLVVPVKRGQFSFPTVNSSQPCESGRDRKEWRRCGTVFKPRAMHQRKDIDFGGSSVVQNVIQRLRLSFAKCNRIFCATGSTCKSAGDFVLLTHFFSVSLNRTKAVIFLIHPRLLHRL